jgi:hypothetical protein
MKKSDIVFQVKDQYHRCLGEIILNLFDIATGPIHYNINIPWRVLFHS